MDGQRLKTNILIAGKTGVGKSSLLNYIFDDAVSEVGAGRPVTKKGIYSHTYSSKENDNVEFSIYDSWGLEAGKENEWCELIIDEVKNHDKRSINEWFSTIIYCFSADSNRVEDFEINVINNLIKEKNNITVVITHCKSKEDKNAIPMKERVIKETGIPENSVIFVSNYEKKLISGKIERFGREKVVKCIIGNLWNNFKNKVPYIIKNKVDEDFYTEHDKLHEMVADKNFLLFREAKLSVLQDAINKEFKNFIYDCVENLNSEFNKAYEYYTKLSNQYYRIVFNPLSMDKTKLLNDPKMFFDATIAFKEEVSLTVDKLAESTSKILKFMNDEFPKEMLKEFLKEVKINLSMPGTIRKELHETIDTYIRNTRIAVLKEVNNVESKLCKIEVKI